MQRWAGVQRDTGWNLEVARIGKDMVWDKVFQGMSLEEERLKMKPKNIITEVWEVKAEQAKRTEDVRAERESSILEAS